jgi:glyoxylase-like metal-dependent hydrolase (beta-lactamase superfamily II)
MVAHVTRSSATVLDELPGWLTLVRANNANPMTLDGTNTWVLRAPGTDTSLVIDPGPLEEAHLQRLAAQGEVTTILYTHSHPDHVEGLFRFRTLVPGAVLPARNEGAAVDLPGGIRVSVLTTPGHSADSVCFLAEVGGERVVFTGDTILGRGTTVVAYPDGDLGQYLTTLDRLGQLTGVAVLPGHGPALTDCAAAATFYRDHRLARLEQVRAARAAGLEAAPEIVASVYADVDRAVWPAAEMSVRAQLAYLDAEPRESADGVARLDPP